MRGEDAAERKALATGTGITPAEAVNHVGASGGIERGFSLS